MTTPPPESVKPIPKPDIPPPVVEQKTTPKGRSGMLWWVTAIIILLGLLWLLYYLLYLQFYEFTDDANANGNMISINSAVSGSVVSFYADDTDFVVEGQLLVSLDPTDYQITLDKELASLAATVLDVRQLYNSVKSNRANVQNKQVALDRAQYDFDNRSKLVDSLAVSNEDYIHAKDTLMTSKLDLKQAIYQLKIALDAAGNTSIEKHPRIEEQKNNVRNAYYNLRHCDIFAPATGNVAQRNVDVGEWVAPTKNLMAIIPTDYVWVDANFKETQLTYMRIGQPATVWFDIYGSGVKYYGKVLGIASGTGSVFSLIPPQNATGNWIKIVQRLPVRISLNPEQLNKFPTRLGISAEVTVDITNQDLPMLSTAPQAKPIGMTNVFDISFDAINKVIQEVIDKNLK